MAGKKIGLVLALDGEEKFTQAMQNAKKEANLFKAELKNLSQEFEGNADSMEALKAKQEALTKQQGAYQRKLEAAQIGLDNAKKVYNQQSDALADLKKRLEEAQKMQQKMEDTGDTTSDSYKEQRKQVEELSDAVDKQGTNVLKASGRVTDWNKRIAESKGELEKTNNALSQNEKYLKEAESAADKCATSIDKFGNEAKETASDLEDVGEKTDLFVDVMKGDLASAAAQMGMKLIAKGAEAVKESMYDVSKASSQLQASTGLSEAAAKRYKNVMEEIRGDNFGSDYSDVASAMSEVIQIMGELNDADMTNVTESAITLRDTFEVDVNESIRAVDVMMKTMGVDATTAFDLITAGAQNGLNRSGELADNLIEYASLWGQAGFSAEEMFAILENGLDAGAYNLDKVNDYVKEFGNSLADGRVEDNLSSFSVKTKNLFSEWKNGNASTSDVFYSVINDLSEMTNQQEALTLASEVWSALGEDNAMQVLTALDDVNDKYKDVRGSMESLKEVRYNDLESSVSGLGAALQENIVAPIADKALPVITELFQVATDVVNDIGDAISPQKTELETFIDDIRTSNDEVQNVLANVKDTMSAAETDASKLETYKNTLLDLNSATEQTEFQKYQIKNIVSELSSNIPELAEAWNEESGSLSLTNEQLKELFDNQEAIIMQNAQMEAREKAYKALADAKVNETMATSALKTAEDELAEAREKDGATYVTLEDGTIMYSKSVGENEKAVKRAKKAEEEATKTREEAEDYVKQVEEALSSLTDVEEKNTETTDENTAALKDNADAAKMNADELKLAADSIVKSTEASAEAQKAAAESILDTYHEYVDEIKSDLQDKINPFEKFDTSKYSEDFGENLTVEKMTKNLDSQIEAFENYQKSLEAVKDHVGKEISPQFMQYLENMGIEGKNTLDHILATYADGEPEKVAEFNDKWIQAMNMTEGIAEVGAANRIAYEATMGELGSSEADFSELRDSIDSAVTSAAEGWGNLSEETRAALEQTIQAAKECGVKIPDGLAEGIANGETSPEEAIAQLKGSIQGAFEGLSEIAKEVGIDDNVLSELAAGIETGGQDAVDAISRLVQEIAGKSPELQKAIEEGTKADNIKANVQSSVESGADGVSEAAPTYEKKGEELGKSISSGIEKSKETISKTVREAIQAGADAIGEKAEDYRQAGAMLGEAVSGGLQESLEEDSDSLLLNPDSISDKSGDYEAAGKSLGEAVVSGLQETQEDINDALSPSVEHIAGKSGDYEAAGQQLGTAFSSGMASEEKNAQNSGKILSDASVSSILQQLSKMQEAGRQQAQLYASAISAAQGQASSAGASLGAAARSGAAAYGGSFYSVGINMAAGLASGINSGASSAISAAANMASSALAAAKARLAIHSPSKKFEQDVGKQISAGTAFGISKNASLASNAAAQMSQKVYDKATAWLAKYKKSHTISLADEQWYWQQVAAHAKKGTAAYTNAINNASLAAFRKNGLTYELAKGIVNKFGVSWYTTEGTGDNKKTVKKDAETYYEDIRSAAQTFFDNYKTLHTVSAKQELTYWTGVQNRLKKGTQAWYDAQKEINAAKTAIAQEEADKRAQTARNQQTLLDNYKTYYKLSEKAELQYWNEARKQFKTGTQERIDADAKYFEARQAYYDKLEELDNDYKENYQEINSELEQSIKELTDTYNDAVQSRKNEIMSSMGLFEAFDATGYDGDTLLYNLQTQVKGLELWEQQLTELGQKGVTGALMEELQALGPDAAANIWSLNHMTEEQLDQYVKLWNEKVALANSQAIKENEPLRNETNGQIAQLKEDAQKELDELNKTYREAIKQTTEDISTDLSALIAKAGQVGEDAIAGLVKGIKKKSDSVEVYKHTNEAVDTLSGSLEALIPEGEIIGKETLDGLLAGLQDEDKIKKASVNVVNSIKRAMEQEAEIHSPSKLFKREIGMQLGAGVETGLEESAEILKETSMDVIRDTLDAAQKELANRQASISADVAALDTSGIAALNNALSTYRPSATIVNVDNGDMVGMMVQMMIGMQSMVDAITGMGIYLDKETLVGKLQPDMSQENAMAAIRRNRGRL